MSKPGPWLVAPFPGVFFRRSVAYWVLVHLVLAMLLVLRAADSGRSVEPAALLPGGNPLAVVVVVALGLLEARRRDEDLFLANLGYGRATLAAYLALPAAALEAAFTLWRFGGPALAAYLGLPATGLRAALTAWR
ncbi:MAG TPA: hypothetical protein VF746_15715 [Longimicrobium sp.]|jgi:hypothetical protein